MMSRLKTLLAVLWCSLACLSSTPAQGREAIDAIVAIVDGDIVMRSELDRQLRRVRTQLAERGTEAPPVSVLERQVLERLVLARLQEQVARRTGIRVDDDTLNQAIGNIARQNGVSPDEFRVILERDGYDWGAFREDIRGEIAIARLRQRDVDNLVTVTDREVDNWLATQPEATGGGEAEYHLGHILVATPEGASAEQIEEAKARAEDVLARLRSGEDFASVAVGASDGQQALDGGDLGWRRRSQLPTMFAGIAPQLAEGETSEIIRSSSGFHIIQLRGKRGEAGVHVVRQSHAEHILVKPNEITTPEDAERRLLELKARIEAGEDFAELARSHSDDRGTAARGGDLGWVSPGDMVPEFERVVESLEEGAVSDPFPSQFGIHIVRVLERRDHDGTEEVRRARAREAIRVRKLEEEREAWLRRLRDEAYVAYRLPAAGAEEAGLP